MKIIAYTITDSGVDGKDKTVVRSAYLDEGERDAALAADKNAAYLSKGEQIIDPTAAHGKAMAKLDGIDKLALFGISEKTRKALA